MSEQPYSGNSAKERCINWFQPVPLRAVFREVLKQFVSSLNQLSAMADIMMLTVIDLTYRRVFYIGWSAQHLCEQIHRFADVTIDEAD